MSSSSQVLLDRVEKYIWGSDENEYLQRVVADDQLDAEQLLAKVEGIQAKLNVQLRQGVEENCPRLLEQVSAIKLLDAKQAQFDEEMQGVSKQADKLAQLFTEYEKQLSKDVVAINNLTKLNRLLADGVKCEELVKLWQDEKHDLMRQAEIINELNTILKASDKLKRVNWVNERALFKLPELAAKTKLSVIDQLKSALKTLNCSVASTCLKALSQLLDASGCQKELNTIMDEAIRELDSLFLQLSSQPNAEKGSRLLPQLGNRLHSMLEQFQLLGLENAQSFARQVGKVIISRVPAMLLTPLDCQSLSNLFVLVDDAFAQDEKKGALIVEKLNLAMKAEFQSVNWDGELQKEMEGNISKCLKYISVKVEQQLQLNEETLRLSGRVSARQAANYQMLTVAHDFTKAIPTAHILDPALKEDSNVERFIKDLEYLCRVGLQVTGKNTRRSIQAELAAGTQETGAQARVRIDRRLVQDFGDLPDQDFNVIRNAAMGSAIATERALYRAKRKKWPSINTFQDSWRKRIKLCVSHCAHQKHVKETSILERPASLRSHIISDGTFKYAPRGTMQIYRIFGLIRQLHATPLVTVLMKRKTSILYRRMWEKVHEALLTINLVSNVFFANFDAEVAAYTTFVEVFREVMLQDEDENEGNAQAAAARPMNQQVLEEVVQGVQEPLPDIVFDQGRNVFRRA
uniref:Conserved oligomeric Golgi complex subunit 5 n=1 Tax=Ditylenchus dipsaci TaxID=166011 RepID=A0A915EJ80_9BILA